jgi:phage-related protein
MSQITFKGTTSATANVTVLEYPDIAKPTLRVETIKIPGKHGEVTLSGVPTYEARIMECKCAVSGVDKISTAAAWLTGRGDLILGNDSDYAYEAQIVDEINFQKILRGHDNRRFTIPFLCQPLKKKATTEADIEKTVSGGTINNIGHVQSRPKIKIEGTGDITLTIGTATITVITGLSGSIVLDSDAGIATDALNTVNMSALVSGDWPEIPVGVVAVSWTGTVTKVTITPRWRYL